MKFFVISAAGDAGRRLDGEGVPPLLDHRRQHAGRVRGLRGGAGLGPGQEAAVLPQGGHGQDTGGGGGVVIMPSIIIFFLTYHFF